MESKIELIAMCSKVSNSIIIVINILVNLVVWADWICKAA